MTEPPLKTGQPTATMMSGNSGHAHHSHSHHHSSGTKNEQMLSPTGGDAQTTTTTSVVTSKDDEESSDCKSPGQRYVNRFLNRNQQQHKIHDVQFFNWLIHHSRCSPTPGECHSEWFETNKPKTKLFLLLVFTYIVSCHLTIVTNCIMERIQKKSISFSAFSLDFFFSIQFPMT